MVYFRGPMIRFRDRRPVLPKWAIGMLAIYATKEGINLSHPQSTSDDQKPIRRHSDPTDPVD
jgi:hypothetical protein